MSALAKWKKANVQQAGAIVCTPTHKGWLKFTHFSTHTLHTHCTHINKHTHTHTQNIHTHIHAQHTTHTYTHNTHTHTHAHTHTHSNTHTHMHTHACTPSRTCRSNSCHACATPTLCCSWELSSNPRSLRLSASSCLVALYLGCCTGVCDFWVCACMLAMHARTVLHSSASLCKLGAICLGCCTGVWVLISLRKCLCVCMYVCVPI